MLPSQPSSLVTAALKVTMGSEVAAAPLAQGDQNRVRLVPEHPLDVLQVVYVQQTLPTAGPAERPVLADPGVPSAPPQRRAEELVVGVVEAAFPIDQHLSRRTPTGPTGLVRHQGPRPKRGQRESSASSS